VSILSISREAVVVAVVFGALTWAGTAGAQPVVALAAGDIAGCTSPGDEATAAILDQHEGTILTLGDNAYPDGSPADFASCYEPSWGRHKGRTRPSVGNHEYRTPGAAGYFDYFGAGAGDPSKGYYSFDLGSWHVVALNSNCGFVDCNLQASWLRADLEEHPSSCTLAYWHHARFSSGRWGQIEWSEGFWKVLYERGADVILSGHDHIYERHAPQTPSGDRNSAHGIRQFIVGTGGHSHSGVISAPLPTSEALNNTAFGVLKLTLRAGGYDWVFLPEAGATFTDSGTGTCHGAPPDVVSPTVSLDAPATNGVVVRGPVELGATAADNIGIDRVDWIVDATLVGRDTTAPYGTTWDSTNVPDGLRWLRARAVDRSGNPTNSEARQIVIDNELPETRLGAVPESVSRSTAPTFTFSSEPGSTFECTLDRRRIPGCTSPFRPSELAAGKHVFTVRALDAAGNHEPTPAQWAWTIDVKAPQTSISVSRLTLAESGSATFWFSANEREIEFSCTFDGAPWAPCVSPFVFEDVGLGRHSFRVRARDTAGNTDWSAAWREWRVTRSGKGLRLVGTFGRDVLVGTTARDVIEGSLGDDVLSGREGHDTLDGGPGRDRLFGGPGRDTLLAVDRERDVLYGGPDRDRARFDLFLDRRRAVEARF
jgi:acid phosphatase type 7